MKFDCGEEYDEWIKRLSKWHRYFAWYPIKVAPHDCRWLEFIERKGTRSVCWDDWYWEYRK